jgi:hypothetical protein
MMKPASVRSFAIACGSWASLGFVLAMFLFLTSIPAGVSVCIASGPFGGEEKVEFATAPEGIRITGSLCGGMVLSSTKAGARRLTADDTPGYRPSLRTSGIGLPSYEAGWFNLNNRKKALLFVTDWSRTILIPANEGYKLIRSPAQPDTLLHALREPTRVG